MLGQLISERPRRRVTDEHRELDSFVREQPQGVRRVMDYKLDLSETVPYVGGAALQARGTDGAGVRVAVLDSGIDYTHKNLGGAGTADAYTAAWGTATTDPRNTTRDGLFPTAKVVDGFDFVGEAWPNADRTEDPDPIDFQGHGSHVAGTIAARTNSIGIAGVAPNAKIVNVDRSAAHNGSGLPLARAPNPR